jgi:hypothetical protein
MNIQFTSMLDTANLKMMQNVKILQRVEIKQIFCERLKYQQHLSKISATS